MDAFTQAVQSWHDFYIMIGTAAATLTGLLFVSLSLNADMIIKPANADLRTLAAQAFSNFILVLLFAVVFLIPRQGPPGLGLPLLGMGLYGLFITLRRFWATARNPQRNWGRGSLARRFALPTLCYITLLVVAVSVLTGSTDGLYWLVPVMILLVVDASLNAWNLLLRLREPLKPA